MSARKGRDLLLMIAGDDGDFVTIAGLRTQRIQFSAEPVEATHAASAERWRELLAGAGVRRVSLAGSGVLRAAPAGDRLRAAFFEGAHRRWRIAGAELGAFEGPFQIVSLDWRGAFDGACEFDIALESAGAIVFTPA